ncbi:hypothetical protein [Caballeronia sp. AZ10_KS36]|uniref:hypothetical protein n=1 Tax=Caballeronia sp. AZ10_KS36 TaxID=2921757 RepID=UPI0020291EC8|nr:hypothetical protein [Caballeronia sp. AZ10_KS36]
MKAIPQPKTKEIIEQINAVQAASPYYVDPMQLTERSRAYRRIKRDVDALFKVDARAAWEATGALKALIGDWKGVQEGFSASLALGDSGTNRMNWVVNCLNLGMFTEGQNAFAQVGDPEQGYFSKLLAMGIRAGAIELALSYAERAKEMKISLDESRADEIANMREMLRTAGVSDKQIAQHLDVAGTILRRHHIRPNVEPRVTTAAGFFQGVTYAFPVPVSADEAFAMNMELAVEELEAGIEKDVAFDVVFEAAVA